MAEWMVKAQENADNEAYDWLESRPTCECCGEKIQAEHCFIINSETIICPDCISEVPTEQATSLIF